MPGKHTSHVKDSDKYEALRRKGARGEDLECREERNGKAAGTATRNRAASQQPTEIQSQMSRLSEHSAAPSDDPAKTCIDEELIARAGDLLEALKAHKLSIVTAESCTAGLISAALAQADGASEILHGSFVTYTKANKTVALGVASELLRTQGSVNAAVVTQLACGALERSPADLALAVSGVLGPEPDEDGNPVGLVFFGCCRRNAKPTIVRRDYGKQSAEWLRRRVVLDALDLAQRCSTLPKEAVYASGQTP